MLTRVLAIVIAIAFLLVFAHAARSGASCAASGRGYAAEICGGATLS